MVSLNYKKNRELILSLPILSLSGTGFAVFLLASYVGLPLIEVNE